MPLSNFLDISTRYKIILASRSPRRQWLLKEIGLEFETRVKHTDEDFPEGLTAQDIPLHLARKKAEAFAGEIRTGELLIAADTIVWINGTVLNKPEDPADAVRMLKVLSGNMHQVFTGVCLMTKETTQTFFAETKVYFAKLCDDEIDFYVKNCKPFDKAGAYGAQEWIGYTGVERIEGSYFNVMGLPLRELYQELSRF